MRKEREGRERRESKLAAAFDTEIALNEERAARARRVNRELSLRRHFHKLNDDAYKNPGHVVPHFPSLLSKVIPSVKFLCDVALFCKPFPPNQILIAGIPSGISSPLHPSTPIVFFLIGHEKPGVAVVAIAVVAAVVRCQLLLQSLHAFVVVVASARLHCGPFVGCKVCVCVCVPDGNAET